MAKKKTSSNKKKTLVPKKSTSAKKLKRVKEIDKLRQAGDPRWKKAARADLEELAEDDSGASVLAAAIKAFLRD